MTTWLPILLAFMGGMGLGYVYFGGLWWTVQRLRHTSWPGLLTLGSFAMRTVVCVLGLYAITAGDWARLAACLAGFLSLRYVLVRLWGPAYSAPTSVSK